MNQSLRGNRLYFSYLIDWWASHKLWHHVRSPLKHTHRMRTCVPQKARTYSRLRHQRRCTHEPLWLFFYSTIACFWAYTNPTKSPKCSSVYFVCALSFSLDGVCVDTSPLNQRMNYWVAFLYQIMTHIPLPWSEYTANKIEMCFLSRPT